MCYAPCFVFLLVIKAFHVLDYLRLCSLETFPKMYILGQNNLTDIFEDMHLFLIKTPLEFKLVGTKPGPGKRP